MLLAERQHPLLRLLNSTRSDRFGQIAMRLCYRPCVLTLNPTVPVLEFSNVSYLQARATGGFPNGRRAGGLSALPNPGAKPRQCQPVGVGESGSVNGPPDPGLVSNFVQPIAGKQRNLGMVETASAAVASRSCSASSAA
jgi:hypothetical protein